MKRNEGDMVIMSSVSKAMHDISAIDEGDTGTASDVEIKNVKQDKAKPPKQHEEKPAPQGDQAAAPALTAPEPAQQQKAVDDAPPPPLPSMDRSQRKWKRPRR